MRRRRPHATIEDWLEIPMRASYGPGRALSIGGIYVNPVGSGSGDGGPAGSSGEGGVGGSLLAVAIPRTVPLAMQPGHPRPAL